MRIKAYKKFCLSTLLVLITFYCLPQELPPASEQQLEELAGGDDAETGDDSKLERMEQLLKEPVNLNTAEMPELSELPFITIFQVNTLLAYRKLLGKFVSVYELQAIPGWDMLTISRVLPYVTIDTPIDLRADFRNRINKGEHSVLIRLSQVLENSKGFKAKIYKGSPLKLLMRYRYTYKNLLQFGLIGEKDAGERFFKSSQRYGFDFYSFHLFARNLGNIVSLAVGDFTVNMGQGLIHWQSIAFKKSAETTAIKRQSAVLRPYAGTGEFNFLRGIGITMRRGKSEATVFVSIRKLSAAIELDSMGSSTFSSFQSSGYHRTDNEIADRNKLSQLMTGGTIKLNGHRGAIAVNGIFNSFSVPLSKKEEPYNLYAIKGDTWYNMSADYSYTYKNIHLFGELAIDKKLNGAILQGILISADSKTDISFLYRRIDASYQTLNGNAFTENTLPVNETGIFAGLTIRPTSFLKISFYSDVYKFPWLKYLIDAPSTGSDFQVQCNYHPDKQTEIYSRYRVIFKRSSSDDATQVGGVKNWRIHLSRQVSRSIQFRSRVEVLWRYKITPAHESGFLFLADILYKPPLKPFSLVARIQYFETDSYDSRMYAYENDVLSAYAVPALYGKGWRSYILANLDLSRRYSCWLRVAQTFYPENEAIGQGNDEIRGKKKTEFKLQFRALFR